MIVIIGAGNSWRRDDGAGRAVAQRLAAAGLPGVRVVEVEGAAAELMAAWRGVGEAVVVDAVASGSAPGTVHRFEASRQPLPAALTSPAFSHGLGLGQALELARTLGRLPLKLVVYGIEGESFGLGQGLSPAVAAAVDRVVEEIGQACARSVTERLSAGRCRMRIDLEHVRDLLARTPTTLDTWLRGAPEEWVRCNEGPDTWSPFDIVGHLIHGERTDWIPRTKILLAAEGPRTFEPFDRFAQLRDNRGKTMDELLDIFTELRRENLEELAALGLSPADFDRTGEHPELGTVTLGQLLATWVAHDLGHLAQIARVMSRQYRDEVGPWRAYLRLLK